MKNIHVIPTDKQELDINTCKNFDIEIGCDLMNCKCEKEEPKQETLEEASTKEGLYRCSQHNFNQAESGYNAKWFKRGAKFGSKWMQERSYSQEEVLNLILKSSKLPFANDEERIEWFNQFKKK
jgi:hypothetical protein